MRRLDEVKFRNTFTDGLKTETLSSSNYLGRLDCICLDYAALFFKRQRKLIKDVLRFSKCCSNGTVMLNIIEISKELRVLHESSMFKKNKRLYDSLFAFTHIFAKFDKCLLNTGFERGKHAFKVSGKFSHSIPPTLLATALPRAAVSQIYVHHESS